MRNTHGSNFVRSMNNWIFFFSCLFWICAGAILAAALVLFFFSMHNGDPLVGALVAGVAFIYVGLAYLIFKISLIFYEFMRAAVSATLEVKMELRNLKGEFQGKASIGPPQVGPSQVGPPQVLSPPPVIPPQVLPQNTQGVPSHLLPPKGRR